MGSTPNYTILIQACSLQPPHHRKRDGSARDSVRHRGADASSLPLHWAASDNKALLSARDGRDERSQKNVKGTVAPLLSARAGFHLGGGVRPRWGKPALRASLSRPQGSSLFLLTPALKPRHQLRKQQRLDLFFFWSHFA